MRRIYDKAIQKYDIDNLNNIIQYKLWWRSCKYVSLGNKILGNKTCFGKGFLSQNFGVWERSGCKYLRQASRQANFWEFTFPNTNAEHL